MTDYSKLSDFEINFLVAEALNKFEYVSDHNAEGGSAVLCDSLRDCDTYDYCNNPSDAWPIIAENHIDLRWDWDEVGKCTALDSSSCGFLNNKQIAAYVDKKALRAAMIVFLMMNEVES